MSEYAVYLAHQGSCFQGIQNESRLPPAYMSSCSISRAQGEGETLQQRRSSGLVKFLELAQAADGGGSGSGMIAPNAAAGVFGRGPYPSSLLSSIKCAS